MQFITDSILKPA